VLYRKGTVIRAFDLLSRQDSLFLRSDDYGLFQTKFSPDRRWVTFGASRRGRSRLFIAALRDATTPAAENEWIPLTGDEGWADKPRWSPDGNLIYFISNRDGFFCLWAQRVAAQTKRPIGAPMSIAHFHGSRLSVGNVGFAVLGLSVARDKIAFNLGELTGNIWVTNLSR
jgi:eukaryotic-like serine/threonine-protein kinase